MKNLLLLFVLLALSLAPQTTNAQSPSTVMCANCDSKEITISLAQKWNESTSLYNAICLENDIEPGKIGMTYFRQLAKEYAISIGLTYKNYTFNGTQNLEILHASRSEVVSHVVGETTLPSTEETTQKVVLSTEDLAVTTASPVVVDTVFQYITDERVIKITTVDTVVVTVSVPVDTHKAFCDCEGKSYEELNMYYTETLANRRQAKDPELKDRYGFCAYQIRKYKASMKRPKKNREESFSAILPDLGIGTLTSTERKKPKTRKRRTKKLGKGHSKGRGGLFSKLFPFANC